MWEFRAFWDKWRLAVDRVEYEGGGGLTAIYVGPFVIAHHWMDGDF